MCTISWFYSESGYEVFFNRDEQRSREEAIPPKLLGENIRYIAPIDPQGGGTWLAANQYGVTVALLNYYQGRLPKGRLISRGAIVKSCAAFRTFGEIKYYIESLNLTKYAPFSLLCFTKSNDIAGKVPLIRWTGKQLELDNVESPLISSAFKFDEVCATRMKTYGELLNESDVNDYRRNFYRLHGSHLPEKSAYSICMHRDDAKTVSFSHIVVAGNHLTFNYHGGSPCEMKNGECEQSLVLNINEV